MNGEDVRMGVVDFDGMEKGFRRLWRRRNTNGKIRCMELGSHARASKCCDIEW